MTRPTIAARVLLRGHVPDDEALEVLARYLPPLQPDMDATWQARADAYDADQRPGMFATFTEALWVIALWLIIGTALLAGVVVLGAVLLDMVATGVATVGEARVRGW